MTKPDCPNAAEHTESPEGYLQWHAWAKKMARTHKQIRCDGCGRFAIWVKRTTVAQLPERTSA